MQKNDFNLNSTFCPAAWVAAAITPNGIATPCCKFSPTSDFKIENKTNIDFMKSKSWENVRFDMLNNNKVLGCNQCYQAEQLGSKSGRHIFLEWFNEPKDINLEFLEVSFSNVCNLACVSCNSNLSTKWAAEDYKYKRISVLPNKMSTEIDFSSIDLKNLKVLKLIGGEPLLEQDKCIQILENVDLKNLTFTLTTNSTIFPNDKLLNLLNQCKTVHYFVSIDGDKSVNEWYRWPTNQKTVINNFKKYREIWKNNPNIFIISHSVINCYNIWTLGDFILDMNEQFPNWNYDFDWIREPKWQSISIIPEVYKKQLEEKLLTWNETISGNWVTNRNPFLDSIKFMYEKESCEKTWTDFKINSMRLAEERKINLFDYVPSLKDKF